MDAGLRSHSPARMSEIRSIRKAVIDIGTNSVKLLVADVGRNAVMPVWEGGEQTRLGRGFYENKVLQPEPLALTATAVAKFAGIARDQGATAIRVVATSAARDAANREDLFTAVRSESGLEIEVISGDTEAEWSFGGVSTNPLFSNRRLLVLDVGGGSTEFILGTAGQIQFRQSFELGSVRAFEQLRPPENPSADDLARARAYLDRFFEEHVIPAVTSHLQTPVELAVGVGGSTAILTMIVNQTGQFDRDQVEATRFTHESLTGLVERLWGMPLAERRTLRGLPPERADVILTGAAIYEAVLRKLAPPALGVSTRGLRFAALTA